MNKVDFQSVCTAPPLEWLAIPKDGSKPFEFELDDVLSHSRVPIDEFGNTVNRYDYNQIAPEYRDTIKKIALSDCHICAFTGYTDSEGEKVHEKHIYKLGRFYFLVFWEPKFGRWETTDIESGATCALWQQLEVSALSDCCTPTIIGHIHIKPWTEEVKALLEKGTEDGNNI